MNEGKPSVTGAPKPDFAPETLEQLFFLARDQVAAVAAGTPAPDFAAKMGELAKFPVLGAFVSVKKRGRLRSCMGYMSDGIGLGEALRASAISAAKDDPRFPPLAPGELYDLDLEIWALGGMREVEERGDARIGAIQVGRDGIQIQARGRRGLLLPSVAVEFDWDARRFLDGVCDKAGLSRDAWRADDSRLFKFEGVSFKKPFVWLVSQNPALKAVVDRENAARESGESTQNAQNTQTGRNETSRPTFSFAPGFFNLRAPSSSPTNAPATPDYANAVRPAAVAGLFYPGTKAERDALLDRFDAEIAAKLDKTGDSSERGKLAATGALVPHAGWIYSGRLALETLRRIEIPETVVVLAPKHRGEGANFAVMPFGAWDFGGERLPSDPEFVDAFAAAFPEFRKDVAAHRAEHSIEVQLPLIARVAPGAKVVGLLIGRSTQTELTALAERFARFLTEREAAGKGRPLLLVSSDMNHYASDARTRELDGDALAALETTEPKRLFETVFREGITMCGVLPAFLATSTLKARGEFGRAVKIGYATSGDATGDRERVVGYAGYAFVR